MSREGGTGPGYNYTQGGPDAGDDEVKTQDTQLQGEEGHRNQANAEGDANPIVDGDGTQQDSKSEDTHRE